MRSRIILLSTIIVAAFSSCSTAYRTTQTPDDVYFSPAREADSYVQVDNKKDDYYGASEDDQWLRMRVRNQMRWSAFDDYDWNDYRYNSWTYASYSPFGWNSYWNNYYYWNSYYNPYCPRIIVINPKTNPTVYTKVRNFSLGSYTNNTYSNRNNPYGAKAFGTTTTSSSSRPVYNNTNSSLGNTVRKVFGGNSGSGSSSSGSYDRPSRSYTPSSSTNSSSGGGSRGGGGSSGGSSGGGGGGGVSRPGRG